MQTIYAYEHHPILILADVLYIAIVFCFRNWFGEILVMLLNCLLKYDRLLKPDSKQAPVTV